MANSKIEEQLEHLEMLREVPVNEATNGLRRALKDRVNVIVSKAARITAERQIGGLIPDLLTAFDTLLMKPDRDPQCWGKNEIVTALAGMGHSCSDPFLRGSVHVQLEPVWGARVDTAVTLRGICVLALTQTSDLPRSDVLRQLVAALTDAAHPVRVDAIRALEQMGGDECALLLRLKARVGDEEPPVTGQAIESILNLEGAFALPFAASFLHVTKDSVREEAALALGASQLPGALECLKKALLEAREETFRRAILTAIGTSRNEGAKSFLLDLLKNAPSPDAEGALEALALHRRTPEIVSRVKRAVRDRDSKHLQERFVVLFVRATEK